MARPPATIVVLGDQVAVLSSFANALPFIRQEKMKSLAAASLNRIQALPDLATVAEFGFPGQAHDGAAA